jgi:hypothetical protein
MTTEREFHHDGDEDFTGNFTASADQDYITLFLCHKGQDCDKELQGSLRKKRCASDREALPPQLRRENKAQDISNGQRK